MVSAVGEGGWGQVAIEGGGGGGGCRKRLRGATRLQKKIILQGTKPRINPYNGNKLKITPSEIFFNLARAARFGP